MINIQEMLQRIILLHSQRNLRDAEILCRNILDLEPDQPDANHFLGIIAYEVGNLPIAREYLEKAIRLMPDSASCSLNMGNIVQQEGKINAAIQWYEKSVSQDPGNKKARSNMGVALTKAGRLDEAVTQLKKAIELDPRYCEAHNNISETYRHLGAFDKAFMACDKALSLNPEYVPARWNRSLLLLINGDFEQGWAEYEWRWKRPQTLKRKIDSGIRWDGSPLAGKTIFIYEEQGMGDTLQFIRYLPMLQRLGAKVVFEALVPLIRLVSQFKGVDRLWVSIPNVDTRPIDRFDFHLPLLSLPGMFNTTLDTIPAQTPYLKPPPDLVEIWKKKIGHVTGFKIGIAWAGHPSHTNDVNRSIHLSLFSHFAHVEGVKLFSLQKEKYEKWTDVNLDSICDRDLGQEISDFADTAAIIENLDLVISVDTAVVHLAGALGRPVWTLLPHSPDWRWMIDRQDSPWYPTMTLFRQPSPGGWAPVFSEMINGLKALVNTD